MKKVNIDELPLRLGIKTEWGKIEAIGFTSGKRYYWMINKYKSISMIPAFMAGAQQLTYKGKQ